MLRIVWSIFRQNTYFIIGIVAGLGLSFLLIPLVETDCIGETSRRIRPRVHSFDPEEYEPRINLAGKPKIEVVKDNVLIRPKFYATELGVREKLFIAVLTTPETISNLGIALNKTAAHLTSKIMFFIDAPSAQKINVSSLKLPGIVGFTDTREILKPFHLIKYILDNFLEDYDFFFIIKDSAYINIKNLYNFVNKISISEDAHVGQPTPNDDNSFCSLDSGILISNSVVRKMKESLEWCVKNAKQDSANDNFGRCIIHSSELPCTNTIQGLNYKSQIIETRKDIDLLTISNPEENLFNESMIVYPVNVPDDFYKLHSYFAKQLIISNLAKIEELRHSIVNISYSTPKGRKGVTWPIGNQPPTIPATHFDILRWDYFTLTHVYLDNDFSNLKPLTGAEKQDIEYVLNASIAKIEEKYKGELKFRKFINGYRKFDPARGMDYVLDLAFRDTTVGKTFQKRIEVCKPLGKVELIPVPYVTENIRINILLPVRKQEISRILNFLKQYSINVMEKKDVTFLMFVFMYAPDDPSKGDEDVFKEIKDTSISLSKKFEKSNSFIKWVSVRIPSKDSDYNIIHENFLDFAIVDLAIKKFSPESLILYAHSNMEIKLDYFNRVRMNTIPQFQVFSAIPFTEFHPDIVYSDALPRPPELDINKNYGHYDSKNTKFISFFAKDYLDARDAINSVIPLIKSDRDILKFAPLTDTSLQENYTSYAINGIYSMFVRASELHVFRAVEPALRLRHSEEYCTSPSGKDLENPTIVDIHKSCIESRAFNLASRSQLARLILEFQAEHTPKEKA
uniref:Hexosyltransferase n=1 Tax=Clastoptera arizonana TaxID=38151 RepID=A0A1B6C963_9HEMI